MFTATAPKVLLNNCGSTFLCKTSGNLLVASASVSCFSAFLQLPCKSLHINSKPEIKRLRLSGVIAENLEYILDHQAGTIRELSLDRIYVPEQIKRIHMAGDAIILSGN